MSSSPAHDPGTPAWSGALLLLTLGTPAFAQDAPLPSSAPAAEAELGDTAADDTAADGTAADDGIEAGPEPGETITVYGEAEVQRRRAVLEKLIEDQGYREGKRRDNRTVFRPEIPWKPSVIVYDEGFVELKRSPVRWMPPGDPDKPLNNLWCIPPFTPMCVRVGGQLVSRAKLTPQKTRVLGEIHDRSEDWRQAIIDQATWTRVNEEVPARVQATWQEGTPIEGDGPALADHAARRKALLDFWASRSDTREGDMVAQVVADFIAAEIQSSPWPVTPEELADANAAAAAAGKRSLRLDMPASPPPDAAPADPPPPPPG